MHMVPCCMQAVTSHGDSRVRGSLASLLEQSAALVRGSASVGAVVTARIDRLRPSQQLTLKVCTPSSSFV